MPTPTTDQFLAEIAIILREKNGARLEAYLIVEPPLPPLYNAIVSELQQSFPIGSQDRLEAKCAKALPEDHEGAEGGSWTALNSFLVQYLSFLRDVSIDQLVETHDLLKALLNQCILALSDASMGVVVLPTVISLSRTLARLAIGLDKRPDLIAHLTRRESTLSNEETAERVTLVESSANVIREAFKKCLSERCGSASGLDLRGNPEGRRIGIYVCANLCLKLFFHCRKLRSAEQIFGNIYQQSPPLARFPTSQRVTYLYYLGRYHFANNHFFRAQASLQAAYNQCHAKCLKQRRSILIYLVASNIILGRFPSAQLFQRSEAKGISEKFLPICQAIKQGDLSNFSRLLDLDNDTATWFLQRRILLQLRNRCEVLVWRSLARKAFILSGFKGDTSKRAPSLDLIDLYSLGVFLEKQTLTLAAKQPTMSDTRSGPTHPNLLSIVPGPLSGKGDVDIGELVGYIDPDLVDEVEVDGPDLLSVEDIESITASLVEQDLLHGYISHRHLRFVITGSKLKPAIQAGFPNVWETIQNRAEKEVPGWVIEDQGNKAQNGLRQAGPGMVVNLSGARPVGVASS